MLRRLVCLFLSFFIFAQPLALEAATKKKSSSSSSSKKKTSASSTKAKAKPKADVDQSTVPPEPLPKPKPSASPSVSPGATASPTASPSPAQTTATLSPDDLIGFSQQPEKVQKLLISALALTRQNLTYKFDSADPAKGGMDCSGFVHYVLNQNGITDVPRQSNEQYRWLWQGGAFRAVFSHKTNTFELDELRPGDLLFWIGTYKTEHDPPITHTMIYLGREKSTKARVMVGSSDGRTYHDVRRDGVSVFDFKLDTTKHRDGDNTPSTLQPQFIGYARVPGLRDE
jgi:cell wall-associated NlpC family hydrolase